MTELRKLITGYEEANAYADELRTNKLNFQREVKELTAKGDTKSVVAKQKEITDAEAELDVAAKVAAIQGKALQEGLEKALEEVDEQDAQNDEERRKVAKELMNDPSIEHVRYIIAAVSAIRGCSHDLVLRELGLKTPMHYTDKAKAVKTATADIKLPRPVHSAKDIADAKDLVELTHRPTIRVA